jgi:hypothetical protein
MNNRYSKYLLEPSLLSPVPGRKPIGNVSVDVTRLHGYSGRWLINEYGDQVRDVTNQVVPKLMTVGVSKITAERGQVLSFDSASTSRIDLGDVLNTAAYTKACWLKKYTNDDSTPNILSSISGGNAHVFWAPQNFGGAVNQVASGHANPWTDVVDPTALTLNKWYHYAVTWDGATIKLYRDGVEVDSASLATAPTNGETYIGSFNGSNYWDGEIDDVILKNYAMTASEVWELYCCPYADLNVGATVGVQAAVGGILNQFQKNNLGSDLYNGTFQ